MEASFNDKRRLDDIKIGIRTGLPINTAVHRYEVDQWTHDETIGVTIALHYLVGIRLGYPAHLLSLETHTRNLRLINKWLGDTRCPMCDTYWKSGNPRNTISILKNDATGIDMINAKTLNVISIERCPDCGNIGNEIIMENGVLV